MSVLGPYCSRFTPVHTGKRWQALGLVVVIAVHPRAYGEEKAIQFDGLRCFRFTPVHTGKRLKYYGFECVFTSQMPSKSSNTTGALPHERISKPCSVFAGYKSTAQPPLMDSQVVAHKRERTRCESVPTYTPAFICSNHLVSLPRSAGGALETTRTINECPFMLGRFRHFHGRRMACSRIRPIGVSGGRVSGCHQSAGRASSPA